MPLTLTIESPRAGAIMWLNTATQPPSPHNCVQSKQAKIFITVKFFTCALFKIVKILLDSRRLDWARIDQCASRHSKSPI